jgi:hypothetical protein
MYPCSQKSKKYLKGEVISLDKCRYMGIRCWITMRNFAVPGSTLTGRFEENIGYQGIRWGTHDQPRLVLSSHDFTPRQHDAGDRNFFPRTTSWLALRTLEVNMKGCLAWGYQFTCNHRIYPRIRRATHKVRNSTRWNHTDSGYQSIHGYTHTRNRTGRTPWYVGCLCMLDHHYYDLKSKSGNIN